MPYRQVKIRRRKNNNVNKSEIRVKTFNLQQSSTSSQNINIKRKFQDENIVFQKKNCKLENQKEISSSEDEEEVDQIKQLLETFTTDTLENNLNAIDSSDDSLCEETTVEHLVEDQLKSASENHICSRSASDKENKKKMEVETKESDVLEKQSTFLNSGSIEKEADEDFAEDEIDLREIENDSIKANMADPFIKHFNFEVGGVLLNSIQSTPACIESNLVEWPVLGKLLFQIPKSEEVHTLVKFSIEKEKYFAPAGKIPCRLNLNDSLEHSFVKQQIIDNITKENTNNVNSSKAILTSFQREIFSIINNYQDFYFSQRTFQNATEVQFIYCLHIINHILKTRTKVLHHNAKLSKKDDTPEEYRDQGLVRPKVLVIVPFRNTAYKIVMMMINILLPEDKGNVINKLRFLNEFTGHELIMPKKNSKPEDYELIFSGNTGDDFRIGMTVKKKSIKLFADFYSSDIIIASPLGLRTIIGADGEVERDYDFLASIELLILDQAEIFMMQNWDHLIHILNHLHLQPKDFHGTDFSRVRTWSLNGWAKYYRQTIIVSSLVLPEINFIFNKKCYNFAGKTKTINPVLYGSICQVFVELPQVFHKFNVSDISKSVDERLQFFVSKILPLQYETLMKQTLIFVSNYFDYVRLRNYFRKEDIGFVQICEYSKEGKVARARDMFFHGDAHFLLYTERFHFFNRVRVKGIRHIVFYQPPIFPNFYYEMCNLMQEGNMNKKVGSTANMTVTVLYSKYDINQLAAIVGTDRAIRMVNSDREVHMLVTDGK